eukprot:34898-Eustigmatos_ZCMA.PRE.1
MEACKKKKKKTAVCADHHVKAMDCPDCKVVFNKGKPIFLPSDHPEYLDMAKAVDLRLTLKRCVFIFDFYDLTVVVRDEHENELWRCDR